MAMGAGGLIALVVDAARVDVVPPSIFDSILVDGMVADGSGT